VFTATGADDEEGAREVRNHGRKKLRAFRRWQGWAAAPRCIQRRSGWGGKISVTRVCHLLDDK
jgi:hypothetical protein